MREIKFRAWDSKTKQMFVPFNLIQKLNQCLGYFSYDIILLQYTGLKDRNGKEIYEGDIVKDTNFPERNLTVEFRPESVSFCFKEIPNSCWLAGSYQFVEVIGNIYENPELLEAK